MGYNASTLVQMKSLGNKWYVVVTKPAELKSSGSQARRSTGTTDKREAQKKQHEITEAIYADFDKKLAELTSATTKPREVQYKDLSFFRNPKTGEVTYLPVQAPLQAPVSTEPAPTSRETSMALSEAIPVYLEGNVWNRDKTKKAANKSLNLFKDTVGPDHVGQIEKVHAYRFAKYLDGKGLANKTIRTNVSYVSGMLSWLEREEIIESSPFVQLNLIGYGVKSEKYKPLTRSELKTLFSLKMKDDYRLVLSILISTGMRLDEAALLNHEDIKTSDSGVLHYDLTNSIVKNDGSKRLVPVHPAIELPEKKGRLFPRFEVDADGKTKANVSNALMRQIRKVSDDPKKVVHSLRGSFKDMLRDADVSKEVNDFITGHSSGDEASKYGSGPSLEVRLEAIKKLDLDFLDN